VPLSEKELLEYIESAGDQPIRIRELARALNVPRKEWRALKQLVRRLRAEGKIQLAPRSRSAVRGAHNVIGRLQGTRRDFGFILRDDAPDLFVRLEFMRDAIHGDVVRARMRRYRGRLEGVVEEVVERGRRLLAGTLTRTPSHWIVVPDDDRIQRDIHLGTSAILPQPSQEGHKALVRITGLGRGAELLGEIETILGPADAPGVRTQALMAEFDLPERFPDEVLASADAMRPPGSEERGNREDFSHLLTFTIDPVDARDHDDAVSIEHLPEGGFELGVHIADVAYYVQPATPLDDEAEQRATSVYLADRVVPMLPELLSNHVCSLRPGAPRLVQSALMRFGPKGELRDWRLASAWIVSRAKLSYEAAEALLAGEEPDIAHYATTSSEASGEPAWPELPAWEEQREPIRSALVAMRQLARSLRQVRFERGSLDIDTAEYKVRHDSRGRVVDIEQRSALESYSLIEEFMLIANQVVARSLAEASLPLLWRIHPEPEFQGTEELRRFLKKLGVHWTPEHPASNRDYQVLLRAIDRRPERRYLMYKVLRSLQKARYERRAHGHFGLAFAQYTHFTSPIRRYPDLYNHRLVRTMLLPDARDEARAIRRAQALSQLGRHTSDRELRAADAERASLKLKLCEFLESRVGETTTGFISSITEFGLYVDMPEWKAEGLVHASRMDDDDYAPDPQRTRLRGAVSGRTFRFGQQVSVRLVRVDPDRRQIDLCLAD
jgi:ribonuclease R